MKYVALLSGGKDSCFNLMHCARNGHELIAAASLGPEQGKEEIDSYMYQTVGQDAIEIIAQALDIPLYRKVISGSALQQGSEYGNRCFEEAAGVKGDETEDLFELLSTVKSFHPDITGVSVGAILSNYQRVRVEHVCQRLALTPLCYLWQRDQRELLSEMVNAGVEAIIIKVAGIGLTPKHLGKTISEMQTLLERLNDLYESHICGEGGEYETLTLDCPMFKRRVVLSNVDTVIHSDNDFATVAYLRINEANLVEKGTLEDVQITVPPLLSEHFESLRGAMDLTRGTPTPRSVFDTAQSPHATADCEKMSSNNCLGPWLAITDIQRRGLSSLNLSIDEEVAECFCALQENLSQYSLTFSNIAQINIFLSSIELFPDVNRVYRTYFGTSPPARACVAVDLPSGIRVRLDCTAFRERAPSDRQALHVQGLSYWAPANIGPYSQAVKVDERIFISGQIGMVPCDLSLPSPQTLSLEAALSWQHARNISRVLQDSWRGSGDPISQCTVYWLIDESDVSRIRSIWKMDGMSELSPALLVGVKSLPKGALIETQVTMHTGRTLVVDEDQYETVINETPRLDQGMTIQGSCVVCWQISTFTKNGAFCAVVSVKYNGVAERGNETQPLNNIRDAEDDLITHLRTVNALGDIWTHTLSIRLFHKHSWSQNATSFTEGLYEFGVKPAIAHIPSRFISTRGDDGWDFALCMFGTAPSKQ